MEHFFTAQKSQPSAFALEFLIISNILLYMSVFLPVYRYKRHPDERYLHKVLAILQLIEYLSIFIWYYVSGYLDFPLPLYHCRLAKLILILTAFTGFGGRLRSLYVYAAPLAIVGAVSSFLIPNVDPFPWPHLTYIGYFFGHYILMLQAMAALMRDTAGLSKSDFWQGQGILFLANILIMAVARYTGTNYSYMLESPIFTDTFAKLSPPIYTLAIFLVYALLYCASFAAARLLQRTADKIRFFSTANSQRALPDK